MADLESAVSAAADSPLPTLFSVILYNYDSQGPTNKVPKGAHS